MGEPFLVLRLQKTYGDFCLDLDVGLESGVTAIFGPSGSGKTTTLDCIAGLVTPDAGKVILQERVLFSSNPRVNLPPDRRRVGYVFQDELLFPHLNVRDNILFGYKRTPQSLRRQDPGALIELLELAPLLDRRPATLSGGEAQRVVLARALATSPEVLLLDEPLESLDARLRGRILRYLKTLHRELGISMVYVSHSLSEILALADQVVALSQGSIIAHDKPFRLLHQHLVQPMVEADTLENLLEVEVEEHCPYSGLTRGRLKSRTLWVSQVDRPVGATLSVAIRASDILIATEAPRGLSARNVLRGTVTSLDTLGSRVLVTAEAGVPLLVEVTREARDSLGLQPGREVFLIIKSSSITVLD